MYTFQRCLPTTQVMTLARRMHFPKGWWTSVRRAFSFLGDHMAHTGLRGHFKLKTLAGLLDMHEPHVVGHLVYLWWSAYARPDVGQDGLLHGWDMRRVCQAAEWMGDPEQFVSSLIESGFLDKVGNEFAIHDYDAWAPYYVKRRKGYKNAVGGQRTSTDVDNGRPTSTMVNKERRNLTRPNQTKPNTRCVVSTKLSLEDLDGAARPVVDRPFPHIDDVSQIRETGMLAGLFVQAVETGHVQNTEGDWFLFCAAADHALRISKYGPSQIALFVSMLKNRLKRGEWISLADEKKATKRIQDVRFGSWDTMEAQA